MATEKKPTRYLSGKVEIKATFSQLRDKKQSRGPGQIGQQRNMATIRLGKIATEKLAVRLAAAEKILETGKVPKAVQGGAPATANATLAKAKGDLTKANKKIEELKKEVAALKKAEEDRKAAEKVPDADPAGK